MPEFTLCCVLLLSGVCGNGNFIVLPMPCCCCKYQLSICRVMKYNFMCITLLSWWFPSVRFSSRCVCVCVCVQECGSKFPLKKDLQQHMITHTGFNPFECPVCHKSFSLERTMQEHHDFVHRGIVKFVCTNCDSKFPRKRNLTRHMTTCRMTAV